MNKILEQKEIVLRDCRVVNLSGCHRYLYWNEQSLFDGRPDTGWCSPSRSDAVIEFLDIEFPRKNIVTGSRLLSRTINESAGFPVEMNLLARTDEGLTPKLAIKNISSNKSCWFSWITEPFEADGIRLEISKVNLRPEGKYFTQFMCMEILSSVIQ